MQKVLHINADKCTGCLQCEMACAFENYGTFRHGQVAHQGLSTFTTPARKFPTPVPNVMKPGACTPARSKPSRSTS